MARFVVVANRAHTETHCLSLYLWRLEEFGRDSSGRREVFSAAESNHVGAREGTWSKVKLEKLLGRYLVFYGKRGVLLQRRRRDAQAQGRRALHPGKRRAEGLGGDGRRTVSSHTSFKSLDRPDRSLLVNAGKHRSSDTKTREAA